MGERHTLIAFCSTLATILALAMCAAIVVNRGKDASPYLAALTGLIGVIGTFRPRQSGLSEDASKTLIDKVPPRTGEALENEGIEHGSK